ncbi:DNA replication protein [Bacillus thuringiensis]
MELKEVETNQMNCILSSRCNLFNSGRCNSICPSYIQIHGASGESGRVGSMGIPLDYRFITFSNSPARESQWAIYTKLEGYVESFKKLFEEANPLDTKKQIRSLYLWSDETGTGKTTLASALLNEFLAVHYIGYLKKNMQPLQTPAFFLDVNELQGLYNKFNRPNVPKDIAEAAADEYYRRINLAKNSQLVVFDDIGVRAATEAFRADLHEVINHRVTQQLPSIYTSNHPITSLAEVYDKRLYDRVRDLTNVIELGGESKRGNRKGESK